MITVFSFGKFRDEAFRFFIKLFMFNNQSNLSFINIVVLFINSFKIQDPLEIFQTKRTQGVLQCLEGEWV